MPLPRTPMHPCAPRLNVQGVTATLLTLLVVVVGTLVSTPASAATRHAPSAVPDRVVLTPTADPGQALNLTWRVAQGADTAVELRSGSGGTTTLRPGATASVRGSGAEHPSVRLDLEPGTAYEYRVGGADGWTPWHPIAARPAADEPWSFLYFGDAQNGLADQWPTTVHRAIAENPDVALSLHAGDLINDADRDEEWGDWFAPLQSLLTTMPTVTTPGNHEYKNDDFITAYRAHFEQPRNGPPLRGLLQGELRGEDSFTFIQGGVRFVSLNANAPLGGPDQAAWLDRLLSANKEKWTVVTFHQPLFSGSEGRDNPMIRMWWRPVLEKHDVDLVLQGHDHVYARGHLANRVVDAETHTGPVYVVSVAGPKYYELAPTDSNNWTDNGAVRQVGANQTSTYQRIDVEGDTLTYRSVVAMTGEEGTLADGSPTMPGQILDAFTITKSNSGSGNDKVVREGAPARLDVTGPAPIEPTADIILDPSVRTGPVPMTDGAITVRANDRVLAESQDWTQGPVRIPASALGTGRHQLEVTWNGHGPIRPVTQTVPVTVRKAASRVAVRNIRVGRDGNGSVGVRIVTDPGVPRAHGRVVVRGGGRGLGGRIVVGNRWQRVKLRDVRRVRVLRVRYQGDPTTRAAVHRARFR